MTDAGHAITLWPEWAFAICHLGKRVENRTWVPPKFLPGKRLAIHAGAHVGGRKAMVARREGMLAMAEVAELAEMQLEWTDEDRPVVGIWAGNRDAIVPDRTIRMTTGAIVATATVREVVVGEPACTHDNWSVWFMGPVGWMLEDVKVLVEPIEIKGAQGLWLLRRSLKERLAEAQTFAATTLTDKAGGARR